MNLGKEAAHYVSILASSTSYGITIIEVLVISHLLHAAY